MAKPGALLLLLAVVASQVDLHVSWQTFVGSGSLDISTCKLHFYGREFSRIDMSFKGSAVSFCFKNLKSETAQECFLIEDRGSVNRIRATISKSNLGLGSSVHKAVPAIKSSSTCNLRFSLLNNLGRQRFLCVFYNFGKQAAFGFIVQSIYDAANVKMKAMVGDKTMGTWSFTKAQATSPIYRDISACRSSGVPLAISSNKIKPETCTKVTCDAYAALTSDSTCGPTEVCRGDNECYEPINVCTVTGSTVVDFFSRVQSVPDRCVYTLLKTKGMQILAGFQERRRKDVAFLDHLVILLNGPGVKIYLEQGGRVRVDDQMLMLNATARSVQGVELSKDQTGVTAKTPFSKVTVFFDGNTAHVKVKGLQALGGLCGNTNTPSQTTTLTAEKSSPLSAAGCEVQHKDEVAICNRSAEYCNLLDTPPFTDCHNESDPKPFISACRETLCKYSDVDSLKCQFLEAYAKTCHLKNVTLGAWRSQASCPAVPQAFCLDQYCSPHEFCGEKVSGETRCFCRAIFASKYKPTNSLGEPTVCMQNSATVALADCLLEEKDIDSSTLHLNDEKCKGQLDSLTHMVIFSYNSSETCGSEIVMTDTQIVYKNTIMSRNSSAYGVITRQDQVKIDFSCLYKAPDMRRLAFKIKDGSVVQKIVSGIWNYTLMMNAYTDSSRTSLVTSKTEITLNEKIWLELKTEGLDANMIALVTDSCWATNQLSPTSSLRYDLIIDGCPNPADNTVNVKGNGLGTSNYFSFDMFEFSGKSSEIYLHCKLELCTANQGPSCAPTCSKRGDRGRRSIRSKNGDLEAAIVTMVWNN